MSDVRKLIQFLRSKGISGDDIAEAVMLVNGGVDPQEPGMDEPAYQGRDVPLTGGTKAQDAALKKRVTDAHASQHRAYHEHRESLGIRPVKNLG